MKLKMERRSEDKNETIKLFFVLISGVFFYEFVHFCISPWKYILWKVPVATPSWAVYDHLIKKGYSPAWMYLFSIAIFAIITLIVISLLYLFWKRYIRNFSMSLLNLMFTFLFSAIPLSFKLFVNTIMQITLNDETFGIEAKAFILATIIVYLLTIGGCEIRKKSNPSEQHFDFILKTMKQNDEFLCENAEGTYLEVTKLINEIAPPSEFVSKGNYGKNAMVFFMYSLLLPFSSAISTNFLIGNLPACFMHLRLILESLVKCYLADVEFPEKEFFQEKIKALEEKEKNITNLMRKMDKKLDQEKKFEQVWRDLSNEWLHTGGITNNIVTQIGKKAMPPSWAIIVPRSYSEEDLDDIKKLGRYISEIRKLLKISIEKYKQNTMPSK